MRLQLMDPFSALEDGPAKPDKRGSANAAGAGYKTTTGW